MQNQSENSIVRIKNLKVIDRGYESLKVSNCWKVWKYGSRFEREVYLLMKILDYPSCWLYYTN